MPNSEPYHAVLKHTGLVLLTIGLLDIALMAYCIAQGMAYSSSLNIFAAVGGIFLLRGSLKAASVIRFLGLFILTGALSVCAALPVVMPASLIWAYVKLDAGTSALGIAATIAVLSVLAWVVRDLGSAGVTQAIAAAGIRRRNPRWAVLAGVGVAAVIAVTGIWAQHTQTAGRAIREARERHGDGYQYHVSTLNYQGNGDGASVSGEVTAWNDHEILAIPFSWRE